MTVIDDIAEPTIAELQAQLAQQQLLLDENKKVIDAYEDKVAWLEERLKLLESKRYQHSSEKLNALQGRLFDESELDAEINAIREQLDDAEGIKGSGASEKQTPKVQKSQAPEDRPKRKPLPAHLRRVQIDIDLSAEQNRQWAMIGS